MAWTKDQPYRDLADRQWEGLVNNVKEGLEEAESGAIIKAEGITAAKLATNAVTAVKIKAEAVEASKVTAPTSPASPGTESLTAVMGAAGVATIAVARYTAKAEASAKVKVLHGLNTEYVQVVGYTTSAKLPVEQLTTVAAKGSIAKVKIISATEVELTLSAETPVAKEEFIYVIVGG